MSDEEIARLIESENARLKAEMQRLRERLAYLLGRRRFLEDGRG